MDHLDLWYENPLQTFEVQVMDAHRSEVQTITALGIVIDFVNEIQRIQVATTHGNAFQLQFRGQQTAAIQVGTSTLQDLKDALEALVWLLMLS